MGHQTDQFGRYVSRLTGSSSKRSKDPRNAQPSEYRAFSLSLPNCQNETEHRNGVRRGGRPRKSHQGCQGREDSFLRAADLGLASSNLSGSEVHPQQVTAS